MSSARAAIAGVLGAAVVAWVVLPPGPDGLGSVRGLGALLGCIAVLIIPEAIEWWNRRK